MLPRGPLVNASSAICGVYAGAEHPHEAQQPEKARRCQDEPQEHQFHSGKGGLIWRKRVKSFGDLKTTLIKAQPQTSASQATEPSVSSATPRAGLMPSAGLPAGSRLARSCSARGAETRITSNVMEPEFAPRLIDRAKPRSRQAGRHKPCPWSRAWRPLGSVALRGARLRLRLDQRRFQIAEALYSSAISSRLYRVKIAVLGVHLGNVELSGCCASGMSAPALDPQIRAGVTERARAAACVPPPSRRSLGNLPRRIWPAVRFLMPPI